MRLALMTAALAVAAMPAFADPPAHAGKGKGHGGSPARSAGGGGSTTNVNVSISLGAPERTIVRDYYAMPGHCPPGLAKKGNGCMPPGQAKKWAVGQRLPRDVIYHDVPRDLVVRLPIPPAGQKYVRVAADILLIAVGTGMVMGAIEDLGRI